MNPSWTETSLLAAAGMDHRFFTRMRAGESFTVDKAWHTLDTANKIIAGEITLDDVKKNRKKKAPETQNAND